jgi:CheY-like chemotaxis protein
MDRSRATKQILIVDDDAGSRDALTNVLHDEGFSVAAVDSGDAAMKYLRSESLPQLIVLDLMMPGMEGWDFRHEQKRDPALAAIPVIAVSAVGKLVDVNESFRKPIDYEEFLRAVEKYARPSRARRSKREQRI